MVRSQHTTLGSPANAMTIRRRRSPHRLVLLVSILLLSLLIAACQAPTPQPTQTPTTLRPTSTPTMITLPTPTLSYTRSLTLAIEEDLESPREVTVRYADGTTEQFEAVGPVVLLGGDQVQSAWGWRDANGLPHELIVTDKVASIHVATKPN